jgi:hypothetical protein
MLPILITLEERNPADLSARAHHELMRRALHDVAQTWQQQILPPRFTPNSPHYPHKRRTAGYLKQKRLAAQRGIAKFGGDVLNVYTGNMAALLARVGVVHATATRATVNKIGPRYITMRPYQSNQPDKWAELMYLQTSEQQRLAKVGGESYSRGRAEVHESRHFHTKS